MANYKLTCHYMSWEIDYALLNFIQLKKSKYYLSKEDNVSIEVVLNLSNYIIDWDNSQLPKSFFKEKFKSLAPLLKDYTLNLKIYEGDELYGCMDVIRDTVEPHIDYYINFCPDMYFSEHLLYYMIESSKSINNKYFVLTPEISKMWDHTWDEITNNLYQNNAHSNWDKIDIFDLRNDIKDKMGRVNCVPVERSKWAGWFDLYNKACWEDLIPLHKDWKGYGAHDYYSLLLTEYVKTQNVDFQEWKLTNQPIFEYSVGPLKENGFSKYYKDLISLKSIPNQRQEFDKHLPQYLQKGIEMLKSKQILK